MPIILQIAPSRALDLNGYSVPGALATFYNSGTTALRTVYADPECTVPHPSPVAADGAGVFPPIFDIGGGDAKVLVTMPDGVALAGYPIDPVARVMTNTAGADSISFDPIPDIPETDVQAAIERVQENIVAPLADYGLGVTGNANLLANINLANIASGSYRFDATTTGTFPSGVDASDGGTFQLWRESSGDAIAIISPRGSTRQHVRSLTGGSWGEWGYILRSSDTANAATWQAGASTTPYATSPANVAAAIGAQTLGADHVWRDLTNSRNVGNIYQNTTGRPIQISLYANGDSLLSVRPPNGAWVTVARDQQINGEGRLFFFGIVPTDHEYRLASSGSATINYWSELR